MESWHNQARVTVEESGVAERAVTIHPYSEAPTSSDSMRNYHVVIKAQNLCLTYFT